MVKPGMFSNMHPLPSQRKARFPYFLWVGHTTAAANGPASAAALGSWSVLARLFCLGRLSPPLLCVRPTRSMETELSAVKAKDAYLRTSQVSPSRGARIREDGAGKLQRTGTPVSP